MELPSSDETAPAQEFEVGELPQVPLAASPSTLQTGRYRIGKKKEMSKETSAVGGKRSLNTELACLLEKRT